MNSGGQFSFPSHCPPSVSSGGACLPSSDVLSDPPVCTSETKGVCAVPPENYSGTGSGRKLHFEWHDILIPNKTFELDFIVSEELCQELSKKDYSLRPIPPKEFASVPRTVLLREGRQKWLELALKSPETKGYLYSLVNVPASQKEIQRLAANLEYLAEQNGITDYYSKANFVAAFVGSLEYFAQCDADFTQVPLETVCKQLGDCEDRTALLVALLSHMGYESAFLFFDDVGFEAAGHIMAAVKRKGVLPPKFTYLPLSTTSTPAQIQVIQNYYPVESTFGNVGVGWVKTKHLDSSHFFQTVIPYTG